MAEIAGLLLMLFQVNYLFGPVLPEKKEVEEGTIRTTVQTAGGEYTLRRTAPSLRRQKFTNLVRQQYDYSCGSAALTTVLNYYLGENLNELEVMQGMIQTGERRKIVQRQAFSLLDMKRYTNFVGYRSAGFRANFEDLKDVEHPPIIPIRYSNFKHFVVLKDIRGGRAFVGDPSAGNLSLPITNFKELWDPKVLFIVYPKGNDPLQEHPLQLSKKDLRFTAPAEFNESILPILEKGRMSRESFRRAIETASGDFQHFRSN